MKNKSLLIASMVNFSIKISGILLSYLLLLFVARWFGSEGVGVFSLFLSFTTVVATIGAMGFGVASLRVVGEFRAVNSFAKVPCFYRKILVISIPFSLLIAILLFFAKEQLVLEVFHLNENVFVLGGLVALSIPFFSVLLINIELLRALNYLKYSELFRSVFRPMIVLGVLFTLIYSLKVSFLLLPVVVLVLSITLLAITSSYFIFKKISSCTSSINGSIGNSELYHIAWPLMIASLGTALTTNVDVLLLGYFSGSEAVGIYAIAFKIAFVSSLIIISVNTVVASKFSEYFYSKKNADLERLLLNSTRLIVLGVVLVGLIVYLFRIELLSLFGEEFLDGEVALVVIVLAQIIKALNGSSGTLLSMSGKQKIYKNIIWFALFINIILNLILIPLYQVEGAAYAKLISVFCESSLMLIFVKKEVGINPLKAFKLKDS